MTAGVDVWLNTPQPPLELGNERHESGGEWRTEFQRVRWLVD